jgi:(R)-citramalyl-CoA lyase
MGTRLQIIDVSPRDGLQGECNRLSPQIRLELIGMLRDAGVTAIEIGSFVNPQRVPQMQGIAEICSVLDFSSPLHYTALVPNVRGFELAAQTGLKHVRLAVLASESLNQANFGQSVDDSLGQFERIARSARSAGMAFGVIIGASFGCPFEGPVSPNRVMRIAERVVDLGADEIMLADTTGMAVPSQVERVCNGFLETLGRANPGLRIGVHLHDTRNTGYANAYAAYRAGIVRFDTCLGGIGGCPFSPGALGNIATEDVVHMFNGMGVAAGIRLDRLIAASRWLAKQLGKPLPAMIGTAEPVYSDPVDVDKPMTS